MLQPLRGNGKRQRVAKGMSLPAPVGGWDAISPLANMPPDRAVVLDNWFPQPGYVEVRRGHISWATGMGSGKPVETLMDYHGLSAASNKLFAVCNGTFFDATSNAAATTCSVTGMSNSRWQHINFTNSSGTHYLIACNGTDSPKTYDGSAWNTPSITGITSSDLVHLNVHKNRIWGVLKDSMNACYLNTDAISGTATKFPLGRLFNKGGFLMSLGTWTHDAGSGPDDYLVAVSSRGQCAVYSGTDPADALNWDLVGVYDLGAPLGRRCLTKVAGDLAYVCVDGVLPFSLARAQDRGSAATVAITTNINRVMNDSARLYGSNFGWELTAYPKGTRAILNVPITEGTLQYQYVMNTLTGAWSRFKGMNANCWRVFNDNLYFGGNSGVVYKADVGSKDNTLQIDAIGQTAYNYFKSRGQLKGFNMVQPLVTTDSPTNPAIGLSTDFKDNANLGTPSIASTTSALYGTAVYGTDVYPAESRNSSDWTSIQGIGQCGAIHFRSAVNAASEVTVQVNGFNAIYEVGEFV